MLQRIGVGAGGLLAAGTVSGEIDGANHRDLSKGRSTLVAIDYEVDAAPEDGLQVSTETNDYAYTVGNGNTVYVSKLDDHPEVTLGSDAIVADTYGFVESKAVGEDVTLSGKPRTLRSDDGAFVGEVQSPLGVAVAETTAGKSSAGPRTTVELTVGEDAYTVGPGEEVTVEETVEIHYSATTGETEAVEATLSLTVTNDGPRTFVGHPESRIVPADHRLATQANMALEEQNRRGGRGLNLGRDAVTVNFAEAYGTFLVDQRFVGNGGAN